MTDLKDINELTRQAYNAVAAKYYDLFKDELEQKEYDLKLFDSFAASLPNGSIVLDAGCGPCAHVSGYINEKGHNVIGIDISEKCIEMSIR